jgi:hypothetical protein
MQPQVRAKLLFLAATLLMVLGAQARAQLANLDKGHRILIERGLQIQAQSFYQPGDLGLASYDFDPAPYLAANFTGINWHYRPVNTSFASAYPAFPWGRWTTMEDNVTNLSPAEQPYAGSFVSFQFGDEQSLDDPGFRAACAAWFNATRANFPNTILYTNQLAFNATPANVATYMSESQPDMLLMDSYRWKVGNTEGTWHLFSDMQRYRKFALLGNDFTGTRPIPYGVITQTFHGENLWRDPSESELRFNHFAAWAMGYKFTSAFTYNYGTSSLFAPGYDTNNPTATYGQLKEVNRQGRNLGPALVRLLSKDVLFVPGQHKDGSGNTVNNAVPIDMLSYPSGFNTAVKDPWIRGVQSIANLGTKNDGLDGDFLLSWFQVLDESLDGPNFTGEWYFAVTNSLVDPTGSAVDTRQTIQINFANTVPTQVQRLDRNTGQLELINLEVIPGTGGRRRLVVELDGGTADLFKFNTGAPFVGAPLQGDFDLNGTVNAADYVVWRKGVGNMYTQYHYNAWRANYGASAATAMGGAVSLEASAVPEPSSLVLILCAASALFSQIRRRGR